MARNKSKKIAKHSEFEKQAREFLSKKWNTDLAEREIQLNPYFEKSFDLVSSDHEFIGDAKYLKNIPTPAAKFSGLAEYVWLLEHVKAKHKFLVFGKDIEIPKRWLKSYGTLVKNIEFYFLKGKELKIYNKKEGEFVPDK